MSEPKVQIQNVSKTYHDARLGDVKAIDTLDISIKSGEIYCLLGPSGCGKSTLLNMVAGFDTPTEGSILVDGAVVQRPGPDRAMVFQQPTLFPWLTVLGNVKLGLSLAKKEKAEEHAMEYIQEIGLSGFEHRFPYDLSGGMQQRVGLARAWVNAPSVLLLDEPFGALDAQTRIVMQALLLDLWIKHGTTILFITHDIDEAIFLGDRIGVMGRRPGVLKEEITVPLGRPRVLEMTTSAEFARIKMRVLNQLHAQGDI